MLIIFDTATTSNMEPGERKRARRAAMGRRGQHMLIHRRLFSLRYIQVEYLVVNYKDDDEKVTLSLRQADILTALAQDEKLAGCVPALQDVTNAK